MLKSLTIQNIALIDRAEIEFSDGLNVLSGETGAGKSVILESIDFVLGAKADKSMIRSGENECFVSAEFTLDDPALGEVLDELEIEAEEILILTRKLNLDGRGSMKINGCPVSAAMLRRVTSRLVDVHGQSEHFSLLKEGNRILLLDRFAGEAIVPVKTETKRLVSERKEILTQLSLLGGDGGERERKEDILRFQIDEIERAAIKSGEEEELSALKEKFRNAEKIMAGLSTACEAISSDGGAADTVRTAQRALFQIAKFGDYGALADRLESALSELEDISETAASLSSDLDIEEGGLERVEARLDEIKTVKKKYGPSSEDVERFLERAKEEYERLKNSEKIAEELQKELGIVEEKLFDSCLQLKAVREETAKELSGRIEEELKTLNMPAARFEIQIGEVSRDEIPNATAEGLGGVTFLFSANAGEPLKEFNRIVSGGEMSRFLLAVKAQVKGQEGIGTYIFDEIDAGIGGRTAKSVAEKFCKMAKSTQIIAISHLAQIACCADRQFSIEKVEEEGKTFTRVQAVEGEARLIETARLLSGNSSEVSLKHAEELLNEASDYKNSL